MAPNSSEISVTNKRGECLFCATALQGRSDKKFCDDNCRNCYHNKNKSKGHASIRRVNIILKKNYEILGKLLNESKEIPIVEEGKILAMNFDFFYSTHSVTDHERRKVIYCYDYGYHKINNSYIIVKSG